MINNTKFKAFSLLVISYLLTNLTFLSLSFDCFHFVKLSFWLVVRFGITNHHLIQEAGPSRLLSFGILLQLSVRIVKGPSCRPDSSCSLIPTHLYMLSGIYAYMVSFWQLTLLLFVGDISGRLEYQLPVVKLEKGA